MILVRKTAAASAAILAGIMLILSGCGQVCARYSQSVAPRSPPTTEAAVRAQHMVVPHAVAEIEISLARIAYIEFFGGNRPDIEMLGEMEALQDHNLHWDAIPGDQRSLLRNVAKRLTAAHQQYGKGFNAAGRPMADFDTQEIIGNAMSAAFQDDDEAAWRALREIYDAWPSLFL